MTTARDLDLKSLGFGAVDPEQLDRIVAICLGVEHAVVTEVGVRPVDYQTDTIATAALDRVQGRALLADGRSRDFSIFVKQLRSARLWPMLHVVPEELRDYWCAEFPWRLEIDAYRSPMTSLLPAGTRLARLYDIVEVDADRAVIWMEDVAADPTNAWTTDHYVRAARALGELAGKRPIGSDTALGPASSHDPDLALIEYARGRIAHQTIPCIMSDDTWTLRRLDGDQFADVRTRLRATTQHIDAILARLAELPHVYAHGDASPQNLLVPKAEPEAFVIIDWGFNSPHAVGFDLGQLLLGLVNNDELSTADMARLEPLVVDAYAQGLADAGFAATREQVHAGYALSAAIRTMFNALALDEGPPDERWTDAHRDNRAAMTAHLLDLCDQYV